MLKTTRRCNSAPASRASEPGAIFSSFTMKIAIPLTASNGFSRHYGGSSKFAVIDIDPKKRAVRRRMIVVPPEGEPCAWPRLLRAAGVKLILAGGMGRSARARMAEHGVDVFAGVPTAAPDALIAAWIDGRMTLGAKICDGSGRAGCHHGGRNHHAGECCCAS
jgi:predicted Fe-Mo cluster-binding NifX family protein